MQSKKVYTLGNMYLELWETIFLKKHQDHWVLYHNTYKIQNDVKKQKLFTQNFQYNIGNILLNNLLFFILFDTIELEIKWE